MSTPPVDIDSETIQFDGQWLGRDELAQTIRALLDAGNYQVARQGLALEALNAALADLRTLAFRVTPELGDALALAARRQNVSEGWLVREALAQYLGQSGDLPVVEAAQLAAEVPADPGGDPGGDPAARREPEGRSPTDPEVPVALSPEPIPPAAAEPAAPPPGLKPAFSPGPGALRALGLPVDSPTVVVETSGEAASSGTEAGEQKDADAVERRWFGN